MWEGGYYSLFIISCEKFIDKHKVFQYKRTHTKVFQYKRTHRKGVLLKYKLADASWKEGNLQVELT